MPWKVGNENCFRCLRLARAMDRAKAGIQPRPLREEIIRSWSVPLRPLSLSLSLSPSLPFSLGFRTRQQTKSREALANAMQLNDLLAKSRANGEKGVGQRGWWCKGGVSQVLPTAVVAVRVAVVVVVRFLCSASQRPTLQQNGMEYGSKCSWMSWTSAML